MNNKMNFPRPILQCSSSTEVLHLVSAKGTLTTKQLVIVLEHLVNTKYFELSREFPWLNTELQKAHTQLQLCYGASGMVEIHEHQGSRVFLESLEKEYKTINNGDLCSALKFLTLLNFDEVWQNYDKIFAELSSRIKSFSFEEIEKAAYIAKRFHIRNHPEDYENMDTLCNKLMVVIQSSLMEGVTYSNQEYVHIFRARRLLLGCCFHNPPQNVLSLLTTTCHFKVSADNYYK